MRHYLSSTAAASLLLALGGAACAAEDTTTVNGLTFYGAIDVGVTYDTHGAPSAPTGNVGSDYLVQKQNNRSIWSLAQSGMGQSRIGLKGASEIGDEWTGLFKLETPINPTGGAVTDALKAITSNNGKPVQSWNAGTDSSRGANAFSAAAYAGISNPVYGTLTLGRQTTLNADLISTYDPGYNSYAFSLIGFSGTAPGAGATQFTRWDNSAKYMASYGPARIGLMYQFGGSYGRNDTGYAADLGFDAGGLSLDATYTHKNDAFNANSLTVAQFTAMPVGYSGSNSLSATIHDDDAYAIAGQYRLGALKLFAGVDYIQTRNPKSPLQVGFDDMGYPVAFVNNSAFAHTRELVYVWGGARYAVTSKLEVAGSYYYVNQNAYGSGTSEGCSSTVSSTCSGQENVFSAVADYRFSKRFETYAGVMYSQVVGGMASGFLKNNNLSPSVGVRYTF